MGSDANRPEVHAVAVKSGQGLGVAVSVVAGVDADLVAAGVDLAQQGAEAQVVQADAGC